MSEIKTGRNTSGLIPWVKGQSANPGGRPKGWKRYLEEITAGDDGTLAALVLDRVKQIALKGKDREALEASKMILDRLLGKPVETQVHVDATSSVGAQMSSERIEEIIRSFPDPSTARQLRPGSVVVDAEVVEEQAPTDVPTEPDRTLNLSQLWGDSPRGV